MESINLLDGMSGGSPYAEIAQLVEHLICNQVVVGSSPSFGSMSLGVRFYLVFLFVCEYKVLLTSVKSSERWIRYVAYW